MGTSRFHDNVARRVRALALTTIFPNLKNPRAAPHMRQQAAALAKLCDLDVWATVPWFPGAGLAWRWSYWRKDMSGIPRREVIDDVRVRHPRFFHVPRVGLSLSAGTYALSLLPLLAPARRRIDVIFATWAYPDGVAAVVLGGLLGIPVVVQVIGSDVDVTALRPGPRRQLRWALPRAAGVIAVSAALGESVAALGVDRRNIHVISTGLDRRLFHPRDRAQARADLGQPAAGRLIVFVGRVSEAKGVRELLTAFESLATRDPSYRLTIVGDGPLRGECEQRAAALGDRLLVAGERNMDEVARWMAACDVLTLPSHHEGTPNVVLEALGSGRRVVATSVGGIPALLDDARKGELVPPRDAPALASALERALREPYEAEEVARVSGAYDWEENARRILEVLERAPGAEAIRHQVMPR
jgi:glycosyltransferase involved in cell wall biosynthesis